ncbi:MAG TPA: hypothetical protein PLJ19_04670 [Dysgonamonadaceae bacterium]|nr:hypothetical protein [Dysgonamonadaceae bacterium]
MNKIIEDNENVIFDAVLLSALEYKVFLSRETFDAPVGNLPTEATLFPIPVGTLPTPR